MFVEAVIADRPAWQYKHAVMYPIKGSCCGFEVLFLVGNIGLRVSVSRGILIGVFLFYVCQVAIAVDFINGIEIGRRTLGMSKVVAP